MKKIIQRKVNKIWGYELWLHSPLVKEQSICEDGEKITQGPLVKIIKTKQPLSIQVHPDDVLAKELEGEPNGKSESWYILESSPETEYIVGINTFDKDIIKEKINNKTFEELLNKIKVKPGDYLDIPAGLVHGIGANTKVFEVQQPSDTTYRFFDYNRLENGKPRQLHIEKSLKSIKDLNYKIDPVDNKFKLKDYSISFHTENITLESNAIVVDFKTETAFLANAGELISFSHFSIITF